MWVIIITAFCGYCCRGKYKEAIQCFKKAIFFSTTEKRLLKLFSFKNGITAQLAVLKRLKIKII